MLEIIIYKTIVLKLALYGREARSLALRKENKEITSISNKGS
jgi:hypothetical protein